MSDEKTKGPEKSTAKNAKGGKRFTFNLSMTGMICTVTVLVLGMVWVFIFGVLVGRGYQPETSVPELARIMPKPSAQENATIAEPEPQPVLKAEELDFSKRLKETVEEVNARKMAAEKKQAAEKKSEKAAEPTKKAEKPVQEAPAKVAAKSDDPKAGSYVYVYQCASFRKLNMAKDLEKRIDATGLNAGIESSDVKGTMWHRVLVHFTGRAEDTVRLKRDLRSVGVKKPIMRSKKPI